MTNATYPNVPREGQWKRRRSLVEPALLFLVFTFATAGHSEAVPGFAQPMQYPVGSGAYTIAAADFDHDEMPDLAVVNRTSDSVSLLLNNGNGTFGESRYFGAGPYPQAVAAADFNRDGNTDIVVANGTTYSLTLLWGSGDGTFSTSSTLAIEGRADTLYATDFNSDGKLDLVFPVYRPLVTGEPNVNGTYIFLGDGYGGFTKGATISGFVDELTVADFDRDGNNDLLLVSLSEGRVFLGQQDGNFTPGPQVQGVLFGGEYWVTNLDVGDLNGDGFADAVGESAMCVSIWGGCNPYTLQFIVINNGSGGLTDSTERYIARVGDVNTTVAPAVNAALPRIVDFDLDGHADLITAEYQPVSILHGDGMGGFAGQPTVFDAPANNSNSWDWGTKNDDKVFCGAIDVNNDQIPDAVWASGTTVTVALGGCPEPGGCPTTCTLQLRAEPAEGGTVLGGSVYAIGSQVSLTAIANCDWSFDHWENESAAILSTSPHYTFQITGNLRLKAVFKPGTVQQEQPDLQAVHITPTLYYPDRARPTLRADIEIKSLGCVQSRYTVRCYLSEDDQLSADDKLIGKRKLVHGRVGVVLMKSRVPGTLLKPGATLFAVVDPENRVVETDEQNNITSVSLTMP